MYKKIGQYGLVGNGLTCAHIGIDGSIEWMCLPYLDSPSVFAAIVDEEKGGRFRLQPRRKWDSAQHYVQGTNILKTLFRTSSAEVEVTDFMAVGPRADTLSAADTLLVRRVRAIRGAMEIVVEVTPRFSYARTSPSWQRQSPTWQTAAASEREQMHLCLSRPFEWQDESTTLTVAEKDTVWFSIVYGPLEEDPGADLLQELLAETRKYWRDWLRSQETGKYGSLGLWQEELDRSALTLKLLQFRRTGAIAAAASCGLPTIIHGTRNWDYRFSWIRDTSMTLQALFETGHVREVELYLEWLKKILTAKDCADLEVLYKLRTPEPPEGETELEHLCGYKGSRPVLIGQYNVGSHQHDIYGELLDMVFTLSRQVGKIDLSYWPHLQSIVNYVVDIWSDTDRGIWELRTGPYHVTHSKVMCWVALDRGIKIAEHYGFPADLVKWKRERQKIADDVLERGYSQKRRSFTQHYDTEELDAALLQIPLVGFLPADDERVENTVAAIEEELMVDGLPLRYRVDDGIEGREHGWLICHFWYLRCLIRQGRLDEVEAKLRHVYRYSNHLGLFGEEYDSRFDEITGNFPQAFSHIGYITTILEYLEARKPTQDKRRLSWVEKISVIVSGRTLNPVPAKAAAEPASDPGGEVKRIMNILRGQFYDGQRQRIDYGGIRSSPYYDDFLQAVGGLRRYPVEELSTDAEKMSFWINVFNTLVIHGVIELGIKESVKEVPLFFERIRYRVGGVRYSLSDIEHGILRGNQRPPYRLLRRLRGDDRRRRQVVGDVDPRIHFALVCASRTCPPVEVYTEEKIEEQLDTSATVFINASTKVDKKEKVVEISEIFKWYRGDFPDSDAQLVRFIAGYLYDQDNAAYLGEYSRSLKLVFRSYDWRLNR